MKDNKYELGIVSVSFRRHEPREILEAMRNAGLTCIEWGSDVHAPYNDVEKLQSLVKLQDEYGITCSSYGTYFYLGRDSVAELSGYINAAKILGTNILRLWCGNKCAQVMSEPEKAAFLNECREAAAIAEKNGAILCMECHPHSFTKRVEDALMLMREINSPSFRMYWQPSNLDPKEQNLAYAEAIAPFTYHIHASLMRGDQRVSLHEGIDEWKEYLSKFSTPRTLLLEFMPDHQITTLPREADALKIIADQ